MGDGFFSRGFQRRLDFWALAEARYAMYFERKNFNQRGGFGG